MHYDVLAVTLDRYYGVNVANMCSKYLSMCIGFHFCMSGIYVVLAIVSALKLEIFCLFFYYCLIIFVFLDIDPISYAPTRLVPFISKAASQIYITRCKA